jgi:Family of unknown function (DUF5819)
MSGPTPLQRAPRRVRVMTVAAAAAITLLLAVHFGMTFVYNQPINPVKLRAGDLVSAWMHPYFAQNWNLFAPKPINENRGMLVRARVRGPDGRWHVTEFFDMTTPANRQAQTRRWWPSRRVRLVSGALQMLAYQDPLSEQLYRRRRELEAERAQVAKETERGPAETGTVADRDPAPGRRTADRDPAAPAGQVDQGLAGIPPTVAEREYRKRAMVLIERLAGREADRQFGPGVEAIQVRVVRHVFPRFSRRDEGDAEGRVIYEDLPWLKRSERDGEEAT